MAQMTVKVDVVNMELFQSLVGFLRELMYDERVPETVRNDYMDRFDELINEIRNKD